MELEELKATWKSVNTRLDEMQAVQTAMQQTLLRGQTKTAANRLRIEPIFELLVGVVTVVWSGGFLADNFAKIQRTPSGAVPVALLYAMGIAALWVSIRQLLIISALDYSKPIIETQRKIADLKSLRVRSAQFMMLAGLPLWFIFPLIAGQAIFGLEFIRAVDKNWMLANVAFGIVASAGLVLAARRFGEQSPFLRKINDVLGGTEVARAQKQLAELNRFEQS